MTKAVFFDIGNTIMYDDPPIPNVFTRIAQQRGHQISLQDVEPYMSQVNEFYQQEYLRDGDFWCVHDRAVQIWLDMYTILTNYCGIDDKDLPQAVYDEYLQPENWSLFPDVIMCLKELKHFGFQLGVISNWDATLEDLLRRMKILPYFNEVVASAVVGHRKPESTIFEIALERIAVAPKDAVHVGDLPDADGEGALSAGIRPIIIDRENTLKDCTFERITTLTDLVNIL